MITFLLGNPSVSVGEILGTDLNIGLLSNKKDKMPPQELANMLRGSGYEHIVSIIPADETPYIPNEATDDLAIKSAKLYSIERDLPYILANKWVSTLGKNYLLIEANRSASTSYLEDAVFQLQLKGYIPVLMQAERYEYLQDNYRNIKRLSERGCLLQTDILSLTGYHGSDAKRLASKLIHDGYASFIGSGVATFEEHNKFSSLERSRKLSRLFRSNNIKNRELFG